MPKKQLKHNESSTKEFQQCTIDWAYKQLFSSSRNEMQRFLVADEVGLGKTIVAKGLIDKLRTKSRLRVIYLASNLHISRQNRSKLTNNPSEICEADRITLLYSVEPARSTKAIYFLTPETSLAANNSAGTVRERLYMARLFQRRFRRTNKQIVELFKCAAPTFGERWKNIRDEKFKLPPRSVRKRLYRQWKQILNELKSSSSRTVVKRLRTAMAKVFLDSIKPHLIILDEFQKYKEILGGTAKYLSLFETDRSPVLLLSATPYRLPGHTSTGAKGKDSVASHHDDLLRTMHFLMGDRKIAQRLVKKMGEYGEKLTKPLKDNQQIRELFQEKSEIQSQLMKFMSRTERVFFQESEVASVETRFLSDQPGHISQDLLKEYLTLVEHGDVGTLLSYWKSGGYLLSYLLDYKWGMRLRDNPKVRKNKFLFRTLNSGVRHLKIDYIEKSLPEGKNLPPLWVSPLRPYYDLAGPFATKGEYNKGLIFSSWKFVPRQIAAELSLSMEKQLRRIPIKSGPLKATPVTWARFYHPSETLSKAVSHHELVNSRSLTEIRKLVKEKLLAALKEAGIRIERKGGSKTWEVLRFLDFRTDHKSWKRTYNLLQSWHTEEGGRRGQLMKDRYSKVMKTLPEKAPVCSHKALNDLVQITISSPAVAISKSLRETIKLEDSPDRQEALLKICLGDIKNFLNRSTTYQVITAAYKKGKYSNKVLRYFQDGNFQAVMDEYLFLINRNQVFETLRSVFRSRRSIVDYHTNGKPKAKVATHFAMAFGDTQADTGGRDDVRVAFNSPFWPFLLATTSVGQEGLDFHHYCKEIYHWNLPSNPVDFEQREGRINRYRSFIVRKNLVRAVSPTKLEAGQLFWKRLFSVSQNHCHRNDRYNFQLSPDWIFTPSKGRQETLVRHVMDLPSSSDRKRYESLMERLRTYRLAFGQPNQDEYLRKLDSNYATLRKLDLRCLYLDLFPHKERNVKEAVNRLDTLEGVEWLLEDATKKAWSVKDLNLKKRLVHQVK